MRLSEQIDALEVLGLSPLKQLVAPRVLAAMITLPLLTILMAYIAIGSSFLAEMLGGSMSWTRYQNAVLAGLASISTAKLVLSTLKTVVFGYLVAVAGCYFGMEATGGTEGVGRAATARRGRLHLPRTDRQRLSRQTDRTGELILRTRGNGSVELLAWPGEAAGHPRGEAARQQAREKTGERVASCRPPQARGLFPSAKAVSTTCSAVRIFPTATSCEPTTSKNLVAVGPGQIARTRMLRSQYSSARA